LRPVLCLEACDLCSPFVVRLVADDDGRLLPIALLKKGRHHRYGFDRLREPAAYRPISSPPAPENSPMAVGFVRLLKVRLEV